MTASIVTLVAGAALCAVVAALFLWASARDQARRDSRRILEALHSSDALLSREVEPLVEDGQALLAQASTSRAVRPLLDAVSAYRARVAAAQTRFPAEMGAQVKLLMDAGVDLREAIDALGRANTAVQDLYAMASRSGEGAASELLHASARCASARIAELGQQVRQIQTSIHQKEAALERLAA